MIIIMKLMVMVLLQNRFNDGYDKDNTDNIDILDSDDAIGVGFTPNCTSRAPWRDTPMTHWTLPCTSQVSHSSVHCLGTVLFVWCCAVLVRPCQSWWGLATCAVLVRPCQWPLATALATTCALLPGKAWPLPTGHWPASLQNPQKPRPLHPCLELLHWPPFRSLLFASPANHQLHS